MANPETNVFRWVNAEGDGLPGLIIDYYGGAAVVQMHSIGMYQNLEAIQEAMLQVAGAEVHTIYNKSNSTLPEKPGIENRSGFLLGDADQG